MWTFPSEQLCLFAVILFFVLMLLALRFVRVAQLPDDLEMLLDEQRLGVRPNFTLISLFLLPVSAFVISKIGKSLKRTAQKTQEQLGFLYASMDENLGGIRVIKAFNAIRFISDSFGQKNDQHQKLATRVFRKRDLSPLVNETLGATVLLALVYFGGRLILNGDHIGLTGEVFLTYIWGLYLNMLSVFPVTTIQKNV